MPPGPIKKPMLPMANTVNIITKVYPERKSNAWKQNTVSNTHNTHISNE